MSDTHSSDIQMLMMKSIDGECDANEAMELQQILKENPGLLSDYEHLKKIQETTTMLGDQMIPDLAWSDYWQGLYNRIERGIGWILLSLGSISLTGFAIFKMIEALFQDTNLPFIIKFGIFALLSGVAIMLLSVIREKLFMRKHDPYKEIER